MIYLQDIKSYHILGIPHPVAVQLVAWKFEIKFSQSNAFEFICVQYLCVAWQMRCGAARHGMARYAFSCLSFSVDCQEHNCFFIVCTTRSPTHIIHLFRIHLTNNQCKHQAYAPFCWTDEEIRIWIVTSDSKCIRPNMNIQAENGANFNHLFFYSVIFVFGSPRVIND